MEHHDVVCSGIFSVEFRENRPPEWIKLAVNTLEEAKESYIVEGIAKASVRSSSSFIVGLHHFCCFGKSRRSSTAGTVRLAPCVEYGEIGARRVSPGVNKGYATTY
jgi:hypothetical protein